MGLGYRLGPQNRKEEILSIDFNDKRLNKKGWNYFYELGVSSTHYKDIPIKIKKRLFYKAYILSKYQIPEITDLKLRDEKEREKQELYKDFELGDDDKWNVIQEKNKEVESIRISRNDILYHLLRQFDRSNIEEEDQFYIDIVESRYQELNDYQPCFFRLAEIKFQLLYDNKEDLIEPMEMAIDLYHKYLNSYWFERLPRLPGDIRFLIIKCAEIQAKKWKRDDRLDESIYLLEYVEKKISVKFELLEKYKALQKEA